jgi:HEAT repeat-containing protein 5
MQANDPHILAAMDGKEVNKHNPIPTTDRKEPTAFFFVVFGLVYEALATASADASSDGRSGVISALQALKCLVRPEYAGHAIMEPTIFEEFISLCYRMGMTEAAGIQIHLIEMLAIFAAAQQQARSTGLDMLSLTSPPAHCLRICSHILKQATSPSRASSTRKPHSPVVLSLSNY